MSMRVLLIFINFRRNKTTLLLDQRYNVNCYLCKHQKMVMLDMYVLDVLILSKPRNRQHLIMSIVNHTTLSKLNFPKRERNYILKTTIGQCGSHLQYMLILNPSRHSCQHVNQTLTRASPNGIRNTPPPPDFVTT